MIEHDILGHRNPNYKEKNSLSEFTSEELKICERISFLEYAINHDKIPTNPNKDFGFSTDPKTMEFELYVNFVKFADPMAYYDLYNKEINLRQEIVMRLFYYDRVESGI